MDAESLIKLGPSGKIGLDKQDFTVLSSSLTLPKTTIETPTKSSVDSLHEFNRNRRDLSSVFNDQDNEFDNNKLTNLDSVTVNRNPSSDNEFSNKRYVDDSIKKRTLLRFNQTFQNYLKASAGNDTYILSKYDIIQITDTTEIKSPNIGSDLLQKWNSKSNNKNNDSKVGNFINSPTGFSGAVLLRPIGDSFMYIETSSNNHGSNNLFVCFERTDIIHISNITLSFNRYSILTNDSKKSTGGFRIQLLLEDNTWSTRYNIHKKVRYSDSSTDWTLNNLNFTVEIYGINLNYDQIDTPHTDMCFSTIIITRSVYYMNHVNFFRSLFEPFEDYRKKVLLLFLVKNENDLLTECGFLKDDINHLRKELKNILVEQNGEYLTYIKDQEESFIEKF